MAQNQITTVQPRLDKLRSVFSVSTLNAIHNVSPFGMIFAIGGILVAELVIITNSAGGKALKDIKMTGVSAIAVLATQAFSLLTIPFLLFFNKHNGPSPQFRLHMSRPILEIAATVATLVSGLANLGIQSKAGCKSVPASPQKAEGVCAGAPGLGVVGTVAGVLWLLQVLITVGAIFMNSGPVFQSERQRQKQLATIQDPASDREAIQMV